MAAILLAHDHRRGVQEFTATGGRVQSDAEGCHKDERFWRLVEF